VRASFKLIRALGYDLYPRTKRTIAGSPTAVIAAALWFMSGIRSFRELLATGKAEACALTDDMVAAAQRAQEPVDVPAIQAMRPL
jgi:2-dehydropantoate 2-reductase